MAAPTQQVAAFDSDDEDDSDDPDFLVHSDSDDNSDNEEDNGEVDEDFSHKIPDVAEDLATGWKSKITKPRLNAFSAVAGMLVDMPAEVSTKICFDQFFTEDMLEKICEETNRYAEQTIEKEIDNGNITPNSSSSKWSPVQKKEMMRFLTLCLMMGIVFKPRIREYWSTDSLIETPLFSKTMSRNRFQAILRFLHLNNQDEFPPRKNDDGSDNNNYDALYKIRPFHDSFLHNCKATYTPHVNVAIDETMIAFRGRVSFRQYIKNKPVKYGIKSYTLAESDTGYISDMTIYTGSTTFYEPEYENFKKTEGVVLTLMHPILNQGYRLFVDNYYTSVELFQYLDSKQTQACGTVRKDRKGLPKALKSAVPKGKVLMRQKGTLLAMKWKDKRDLHMLSTMHDASSTVKQVRSKTGMKDVRKPSCVITYNDFMLGVDRADQLMSYYPFDRKSLKWWKKVFFYLLSVAVCQAMIIYKISYGIEISQYDFRLTLFRELFAATHDPTVPRILPSVSRNKRKASIDTLQRLEEVPELVFVPPTEKRMNAMRKCFVCSSHNTRKETRYMCATCNKAFCVVPCFSNYHTKINY